MSFLLLILGLALWWGAHLFKRIAPGRRALWGDRAKGVIALLLLASVVLMVLGFRGADFVPLWEPPRFLVHVNNLLMLGAFFLFAADGMRAPLVGRMRHPQLTGFSLWAVAHLLVNGDLASVVMFGGLLAWALVTMLVINTKAPLWTPKPVKPGATLKAALATAVLVPVVMGIHNWLGVQPWGG